MTMLLHTHIHVFFYSPAYYIKYLLHVQQVDPWYNNNMAAVAR